jgi:Flp pilus assembly pilin Flp
MKNPHNQGALCAVVCAESQRHPQRGAALLEYALVVALVAVVGISGVGSVGQVLERSFGTSQALVAGAGAGCQPNDPRCVNEDDAFGQ